MYTSLATFLSMALFLIFKSGRLLHRGPGPPSEQLAAEPYKMDVKLVQPYQTPVSYMRSLVSQLQATPRDINFFLELGREPNAFSDVLDNYQHGISAAIQLANTLLGLLALGGVLVVAGRLTGFCGGDDIQDTSPHYNAFFTATLGVTLFLAALDVLLAFVLYQSSSDLAASIDMMPSVKAMAMDDLAAFVKNTVQQKLVIAEREKRHRLEELEENFHRGFSTFLKARIKEDMMLYQVPNVSDCAENIREIGMMFIKDGASSSGRQVLRAGRKLSRVRQFRDELCDLVARKVEEATSRERAMSIKRLQSDIPDASLKAELSTTLSGLENAANRLMTYGAKTGWFDRFKSTIFFTLLPVLFLLLLAVLIPFCIGGMTQQSFTIDPEERSMGSHIAGQALICCSFILFLFALLALYIAIGLFPYGAVGECYVCQSYRQGSFNVLNLLAVRLWPLNERAAMFQGIHPSEVLSKCGHGEATLADLSVPYEVRLGSDIREISTPNPIVSATTTRLEAEQRAPVLLVDDKQVSMLGIPDIDLLTFIRSLRHAISKEGTLSNLTRRKTSAFLQKWDNLDLTETSDRIAASTYKRFLLTMLGKYYNDYLNGPEIRGRIGNCEPVYNVVDKTMGAACGGFIDSLLAYVFLLVMVAVLSIFLVVMAAKSGKKLKKKKKKGKKKKKKKKGKKKKKKTKDSTDADKSTPSMTPPSAPSAPATPPSADSARLSKATEDAVIRITTTRTGDSPTGSIDRSDTLEIRIPTPPAPPPPPSARAPTHTVETVHIKIPPPAQPPPPPVAAPQRQNVSTIEIHLPSQYLTQAAPPPPKRQVHRSVSLTIGETGGIPVARRSSSQTTTVYVDGAPQRRITHHRLNTASWPWHLWYPFWGGGVHENAVRVSSSIELAPMTAVPSVTQLRRVTSGPLCPSALSCYPHACPQSW